MAENAKKYVTGEALKSALTVVRDHMVQPGDLKTINGENIVGSGDIKIDLSLYKVVSALPTADIDENKIYLVLSAAAGETNKYTEYVRVSGAWEKIGEYKADVDLTPYAKTADVEAKVKVATDAAAKNAGDIAKNGEAITDLQTTSGQKADKTYVDETFVKQADLDSAVMTEAEGTALAEALFA